MKRTRINNSSQEVSVVKILSEEEISTVEASGGQQQIRAFFAGRDNALLAVSSTDGYRHFQGNCQYSTAAYLSGVGPFFCGNHGHIPFRRFTYRHVYLFIRLLDEIILDGNRIYRASQSNYCPGKVGGAVT
jgi:hypothetical protein